MELIQGEYSWENTTDQIFGFQSLFCSAGFPTFYNSLVSVQKIKIQGETLNTEN